MTTRRTAAAIFALGLVLRLATLLVTFDGNDRVAYYDDAKIALNLVNGRGYSIDYSYRNWLFYEMFMKHGQLHDPILQGVRPTASKQPVYPFVLAVTFLIAGPRNFLVVFVLHAVLSAGTAALMYRILKRISNETALIGGTVVAVYPAFIVHSTTTPESTTLLLFLLSVYMLCFVRLSECPSMSRWLALGALGGVVAQTEPVTIPFVGLSLLTAGYLHWTAPILRIRPAFSALVLALTLTPWLARNYVVFGHFPVMKDIIGNVFNWGLERSGRGTWISDKRLAQLEYEGRAMTEFDEDQALQRELRTLFSGHAKEYLLVNIPLNFVHFWWDVAQYAGDVSPGYLLGRRLPYLFIAFFGLSALPRHIRRIYPMPETARERAEWSIPTLALTLILTSTAVYTVFGAYFARYRFPVELALIALAAPMMARVSSLVVGTLAAASPLHHSFFEERER